jgi:IclR family transcriptional regulator, acetate operon repressor
MPHNGGSSLLDRAFDLLGQFTPERSELSLAELTERSGLPRSTTHRLARQLESLRVLERTRRGWRIGVRIFELGQLVPTQQRLREQALPFMGDLYEATRGTIHLAVLEGSDVVYVEVIAGRHKVRSPSRRGGRVPAHCTAVGKVLLAYADPRPDPDGPSLEARTKATITDPRSLASTLAMVRRRGIAFDDEEAMAGLRCVAAPVYDQSGVVAALSVSLSTRNKLTPEGSAPVVRTAAMGLSRELRGPGA